jgi:hypothetical protein
LERVEKGEEDEGVVSLPVVTASLILHHPLNLGNFQSERLWREEEASMASSLMYSNALKF